MPSIYHLDSYSYAFKKHWSNIFFPFSEVMIMAVCRGPNSDTYLDTSNKIHSGQKDV